MLATTSTHTAIPHSPQDTAQEHASILSTARGSGGSVGGGSLKPKCEYLAVSVCTAWMALEFSGEGWAGNSVSMGKW